MKWREVTLHPRCFSHDIGRRLFKLLGLLSKRNWRVHGDQLSTVYRHALDARSHPPVRQSFHRQRSSHEHKVFTADNSTRLRRSVLQLVLRVLSSETRSVMYTFKFSPNSRNSRCSGTHACPVGEPLSNSSRVAARRRTAQYGTARPPNCSSTPLTCSWIRTAGKATPAEGDVYNARGKQRREKLMELLSLGAREY